MKLVLVIALLAFPVSAHAQSSTTCSTIGNVTNCQHQGSAAPYDYGAIMRRGASIVPNYQDQELKRQQVEALRLQNEAARAAAKREREASQPGRTFVASLEARKAMATLLREGKCDDAIGIALDAGDIALAADVKAFCKP